MFVSTSSLIASSASTETIQYAASIKSIGTVSNDRVTKLAPSAFEIVSLRVKVAMRTAFESSVAVGDAQTFSVHVP